MSAAPAPFLGVHEPPCEPEYPFHDGTVRVTRCGHRHWKTEHQSQPGLRRPILGPREVDDRVWLVSFLGFDLGLFDNQEDRVEPASNPFAPENV
jgi:putative transposase